MKCLALVSVLIVAVLAGCGGSSETPSGVPYLEECQDPDRVWTDSVIDRADRIVCEHREAEHAERVLDEAEALFQEGKIHDSRRALIRARALIDLGRQELTRRSK